MNGTISKQDFTIIRNNPNSTNNVVVNGISNNECCFVLPALAEIGSPTSDLKNDKHSVIWFFDNGYTDAEMYIEKLLPNGDWLQFYTLDDNTYGTFYALGFYETIYAEKAIGYQLEWNKVINDSYGTGNYRIRCRATLIDSSTQDFTSFEFCLKEYTESRANKTTRLDWYKNGNSGSLSDDTRKVDYGILNWYNSIRLPKSYFGKTQIKQEKNYTKYQTGQNVWIKDSIDFDYTLQVNQIPTWLSDFISLDANVNSEMYITDYNIRNEYRFTKKAITSTGVNYTYSDGGTNVTVEYQYKPFFNNFNHNRE
jgi:hypothetical protein